MYFYLSFCFFSFNFINNFPAYHILLYALYVYPLEIELSCIFFILNIQHLTSDKMWLKATHLLMKIATSNFSTCLVALLGQIYNHRLRNSWRNPLTATEIVD